MASSWLRGRVIEVQDEPSRERWEEVVSNVRVQLPSSIFPNHSPHPTLEGVVEYSELYGIAENDGTPESGAKLLWKEIIEAMATCPQLPMGSFTKFNNFI